MIGMIFGIDNHSHSRSTIAMIICVCKAVSDKHIRAAVAEGVTSMNELARELRVGTCCGKCVPEAKAALSACVAQCARHAERSASLSAPSFFSSSMAEFAT